MNHIPDPLFKRGLSTRTRMVIFATVAIALLFIDARLKALEQIRSTIGLALYPLEQLALIPVDAARTASQYLVTTASLASENADLRKRQLLLSQLAEHGKQLETENARLRALLSLHQHSTFKVLAVEVSQETRDPYTPRVVIDRGSRDGVQAGFPVIDERGVVGQVTRVFLLKSEVTLLTDRDQSIPVEVTRNGLRSIAYGSDQPGQLELRFLSLNADLEPGDVLVTSGLDGVYPSGLPVATIEKVERNTTSAFSHARCQPIAGLRDRRHLLVLLSDQVAEANSPPTAVPSLRSSPVPHTASAIRKP